ncbi:MAG: TMEM165/GDT1 family protein [Bacillota bacterium]
MLAAAVAAFLTVFIAEFGDKSQLVCLTMACRYPPLQVLAGAMTAMVLVLGLAAGAGSLAADALPHSFVAVISGIFFVGVGIFTWLRGEQKAEEGCANGGYFQTLGMIFLAEFGDKTQLAVLLLAASLGLPFAVFGGAILAMFANHALAVYIGNRFVSRLKPEYVKISSTIIFVAIGLGLIIFETGFIF